MTTYALPVPPSTNNLFVTVGKRRRVLSPEYRDWKALAAGMLLQQRAKPFPTPCRVTINVDETQSRADIDNLAKAPIDALVAFGVLPGDSNKHIRRVSIGWEPVAGCTVHLEAI